MQTLDPQKLPFADRWAAYQLLPASATWGESWKQMTYLMTGRRD